MENGPDTATGLYDVKRLAKRMGVKTSTIRSMKARGTIPAPTCNDINGGAVWSADIINQFLGVDKAKFSPVKHNLSNENLPKIIDLFSGCGGMSLGFSKAGFEIIAGFDNWEAAVNTYNNNFEHNAYMLDLDDLESTIARLSPYFVNESPAIIGGPPCQDFSSAGKRKEGDRADLTEKFATIVTHFKPPFFVMENVDRAEKSNAFMQAKKTFINAGYFVQQIVLNASYCGVPQRRKRLFTFGSFSEEKPRNYYTHYKETFRKPKPQSEITLVNLLILNFIIDIRAVMQEELFFLLMNLRLQYVELTGLYLTDIQGTPVMPDLLRKLDHLQLKNVRKSRHSRKVLYLMAQKQQ